MMLMRIVARRLVGILCRPSTPLSGHSPVAALSMGERVDVGIRNNFLILLSARIAAGFEQSFPVVLDEPFQGGFRMLIHGADGGHQTRVQESLHSFAELIRGTLGGAGDVGLQ